MFIISYYLFYFLTSHSLFNSIRLSFPLLHYTYVFSFPSILKSDVQFIFSFYLIYFYFLSCLCALLDLSSVPSFSRFYVTYHKKFEEGKEIIHSVYIELFLVQTLKHSFLISYISIVSFIFTPTTMICEHART